MCTPYCKPQGSDCERGDSNDKCEVRQFRDYSIKPKEK